MSANEPRSIYHFSYVGFQKFSNIPNHFSYVCARTKAYNGLVAKDTP